MLRILLSILMFAFALPAMAQDDGNWRFGGDAYMAGRNVTLSGESVQDLFMAGDKITASSDIGGSAHMAGRYITLDSRVGQNFYGLGMEIELDGTVAGNVSIAGDTLTVNEPVAGNLRAMGSHIEIDAPVAGSAVIGGDKVVLNAEIGGDLALGAEDVTWGDAARVRGEVHVYTDERDGVSVPESVASADRVVVHEMDEFDDASGMSGMAKPGFFDRLRGWLGSVIVIGVLGTIFAAVAPAYLAGLRERALARPVKSGVIGFVGLSAVIGSVVLLAMTGLGVLLIPVSIIAAILLGITGYVIGTYVLGVWAVRMSGRPVPDSMGTRATAAFVGAAIGALIGLVPWLGWLAVMAIFLVGAGVLTARILKLGETDETLA